MALRNLRRTLHRFRWRASNPLWRWRLARSAGVWALIAMTATAPCVGFISANSQASVSEAFRTFGQCRVNTYDCRAFSTRFEAQAVYWAVRRQNEWDSCGGWLVEALAHPG